jgi:UDP-N-acetylmuramoyl-L-alanyl-D-glutamate--2,6-diaminopimelate ligase
MIGYLTQDYALIHALGAKARTQPVRELKALNRFIARAPKLSDYINEDEVQLVKGNLDCPVSGLATESKRVVAGNVFFVLEENLNGFSADIDEAISRGATAIVTTKVPSVIPSKVAFVKVKAVEKVLVKVAKRYFKSPDKSLALVGIAGSNGKTTVSYLIKALLGDANRSGLFSSISYDLGTRVVPSFKSTPDAVDLFGMMAQMRDAGLRKTVLEIESAALLSEHIHSLQLKVGVFTNLNAHDLDTIELEFKKQVDFFTGKYGNAPEVAVVNISDCFGLKLAEEIRLHAPNVRLITVGYDQSAHVIAERIVASQTGTSGVLKWKKPDGMMGEASFQLDLVGSYNVTNLLCASAACLGLDKDPALFLNRLKQLPNIPGRMQRIDVGQAYEVVVDHAPTSHALYSSLEALRKLTPGRLLVVFGSASNRSVSERKAFVEVVQAHADFSFVTLDSTFEETPEKIFSDMNQGVRDPARIAWVEDRRRAINVALDVAKKGDTVLITGRGHESFQYLGDAVHPFDDRKVVAELIHEKLPTKEVA